MTQADMTQTRPENGVSRAGPRRPAHRAEPGLHHDGSTTAAALAAGSIVTLLGLSRRSLPGAVTAALGGTLLYRGVTGHWPVAEKFALRSSAGTPEAVEEDLEQGIHVETSFLINRTPDELYRYWRTLSNLPAIMSHVKSVTVVDDRRSHWVADAPALVGGKVEWDAEITRDEPGSAVGWRSLPGSQIESKGEIRFSKALGDRGTEAHVWMEYLPPAGRAGHWLAKVFGKSPHRQIRDDLRNFKRIMEIGEVLTTSGQPRGTCLGKGKLQG